MACEGLPGVALCRFCKPVRPVLLQRGVACTTKPPGQKAPEGRWTRTLACRVSVMAAARVLRQGSVARSLEDVGDQSGEGTAVLIGSTL